MKKKIQLILNVIAIPLITTMSYANDLHETYINSPTELHCNSSLHEKAKSSLKNFMAWQEKHYQVPSPTSQLSDLIQSGCANPLIEYALVKSQTHAGKALVHSHKCSAVVPLLENVAKDIVKDYPELEFDVMLYLGQCERALEHKKKAEIYLNSALVIEKESLEVLLGLAELHKSNEEYSKSLNYYHQALNSKQVENNYSRGFIQLEKGIIYTKRKEYELALTALNSAEEKMQFRLSKQDEYEVHPLVNEALCWLEEDMGTNESELCWLNLGQQLEAINLNIKVKYPIELEERTYARIAWNKAKAKDKYLPKPNDWSNYGYGKNLFGWETDYKKLMLKAGANKNDPIFERFEESNDLVDFDDSSLSQVQSAIQIDILAFWYMGYRYSTLYLQKPQGVEVLTFEEKNSRQRQSEIQQESYSKLYDALKTWEQSKAEIIPLSDTGEPANMPAYIGAINLYDGQESQQILVTPGDVMRFESGMAAEQMAEGELWKLIREATE